MKIQIDTIYLRDLVYQMFRNLDDGEYYGKSSVCCGMLDAEKSLALDNLIEHIEKEAKGNS